MYAIVLLHAHEVETVIVMESYFQAVDRAVLLAADHAMFDRFDDAREREVVEEIGRTQFFGHGDYVIHVVRAFQVPTEAH